MARGITQEQVNEAADAILGAGENPTVEKVRAELGTGSPNTITRMLDAWRGQLGERLRQLNTLPDVPSTVGQAMIELWRLATEHAESVIEGRFATARASLEAGQAQLAREHENWEARLQLAETSAAQAHVARELAEHACATLDGQLQDSHALRSDLMQQRDRLQEFCDRQLAEIQALQTHLNESRAALRMDRERQEAHIRAVEDRSQQEIDRARQEAKHCQQRLEATEQAHQRAIASLQKQQDTLRDQLRKAENEVARYTGLVSGLEKTLAKTKTRSAVPKRPKAKKAPPRRG